MTGLLFVRITNKRARRDRALLQSSPRLGGRGEFGNRAPLAPPTRRSAGCRIAAGFAQTRRSPPWSAQARVSPQALLRRTMSWRISVGVAVVEQDAPHATSPARQDASAGRSKIGRLQPQHATRATTRS